MTKDNQLDYEGELGVVIGRGGRNIPESKALDHVLGYVVANDISARKWQRSVGGQFCYGKVGDTESEFGQLRNLLRLTPSLAFAHPQGFDNFAPFGPMIVSTRLIPDPSKLTLTTHVNSELRQNSPTSDLIFSIPQIIAFLSQGYTLLPNTVIMSGTPAGVGQAWQGGKGLLKDGDVVEVRISELGTLRNKIVFEKEGKYVAML